jgi:hypothetical protein
MESDLSTQAAATAKANGTPSSSSSEDDGDAAAAAAAKPKPPAPVPFTDDDYAALARYDLNGRQIKNTVRTAQALAVNRGEVLCMTHLRQVLDVHLSFDRDLKGGTGYQDAMRGYM